MDAITLSFRYSEQDYVRAMRAHYASRLRLPLDIVLTAILAILGAWLWRIGSESFALVLFCFTGAFAILLLAAFFLIPHFAFRQEPKFRDEYMLTFSPDRIHFQTVHIDSSLDWEMYSRVLADKYSFLLYYGSRTYTIVPKRVFGTEAQKEAFEQLLSRKIPVVIDKTGRKQTPVQLSGEEGQGT